MCARIWIMNHLMTPLGEIILRITLHFIFSYCKHSDIQSTYLCFSFVRSMTYNESWQVQRATKWKFKTLDSSQMVGDLCVHRLFKSLSLLILFELHKLILFKMSIKYFYSRYICSNNPALIFAAMTNIRNFSNKWRQ